MTVVYDAGALVAAERNDRSMWAQHRVWIERGTVPAVPAPVLAQVSRSPRQAQLRRLLRGCDVVAFDEPAAHAAGALLATSGTTDIADAAVVVLARARLAPIATSDRRDIEQLLEAAGERLAVIDV
jgi:hypothetical protein